MNDDERTMNKSQSRRQFLRALGYALSFPVSAAIVGISTLRELEENVQIAGRVESLPKEELAALEKLSEPYAAEANFFKHHW